LFPSTIAGTFSLLIYFFYRLIILNYARRQHKNKNHSSTKWKINTNTVEKN